MQTTVRPIALAEALDPTAEAPDTTALVALYDRSVDSVKGYEKMVEMADPSFRATARGCRHVARDAG